MTISARDFQDESFRESLAEFLEQASSETFARFAAQAHKANRSVIEARDCPNPALISEMLMSLLEGLGGPANIRQLRKRDRDDVVLGASEIPWRRSPFWLILRVTMRRLLSSFFDQQDGDAIGRVYYKYIICAMLANLLKDSAQELHPEMILMIRAKLCRRLAKLESERLPAQGSLRLVYEELSAATDGVFAAAVTFAQQQVVAQWNAYKKSIVRRIPIIPFRASEDDIKLDLSNSRQFLLSLISHRVSNPQRHIYFGFLTEEENTVSQYSKFAARYSRLIDVQVEATKQIEADPSSAPQDCIDLSQGIMQLLTEVGTAYNDNPIPMSRYILKLFELWTAMDKAAIEACPLLENYHPGFDPRALDVLCLLTVNEMKRLSRVQEYLAGRIEAHIQDHETMFRSARRQRGFALKFMNLPRMGSPLRKLAEEIDAASNQSRRIKEAEFTRLASQYRDLTEAIGKRTCTCKKFPDGSRDIRGCKRCWQCRCRKKLKLQIHEDYLPSARDSHGQAHRAAILFELEMPEYLQAYRTATWKLMILGNQVQSDHKMKPNTLFKDLDQLKRFWNKGKDETQTLTLASQKKSFLQTHYAKIPLPKKMSQVLLPFSAELSYYDSSTGLWADLLAPTPWYQHLLGTWLPSGIRDPYGNLETVTEHAVFSPSSYEISASGTTELDSSVHEFSAFQRAVSGRGRRWLELLIELAATNLNFSSEGTATLINRLALQAGPAILEKGYLREAYQAFGDDAFCERLLEQLHRRLNAVAANFREASYMSILVTLALRLHLLSPQGFRPRTGDLLSKIRDTTSKWIAQLRTEVRSTSDGETGRKASTSALRAALLCRQTFSVCLDAPEDDGSMSEVDIRHFFQASIAMQENLLMNVGELAPSLHNMLVQDLSMSHQMRDVFRGWFISHHDLLEDAINETWTSAGDLGQRCYSPWTILDSPAGWATSQIARTDWASSQVVHYHYLQGHLMVDGKPLGRLPLEIRDDPSIRELFEGQHLLTRPSSILEYQLVSEVEGHQLHVGLKAGKVVIQAIFRGELLEHVPRAIFKGIAGWDLPAALVDECVHWLNLRSGKLEMRRKPFIWRSKLSHWVLDPRTRTAIRNQGFRNGRNSPGAYLVEPRSTVGIKILGIFRGFEDVERLTIYQPAGKGSLSVEMKRLEIRFFVNSKRQLECPQLGAEIDPQQELGTLHGLSGQLILQNVSNPDMKTLLVPIGEISWERRGIHVTTKILNAGLYARFTVNRLLGRLECPPEPLLLYLKAALHALTSFPLADELTGHTGTEEARHCLLSARSQPWTPLRGSSKEILSAVKSLSPKRCYYPPETQLYQRVAWDPNLTMTIQHEDLASLVDSILLKSRKLEMFESTSEGLDQLDLSHVVIGHLTLRGIIRRQVYERICFASDSAALDAVTVAFYLPDSQDKASKQSCRAYQTVCALRSGISSTPKPVDPVSFLNKHPHVQGFNALPLSLNIAAILDTDISQLWGSLVKLCQQTGPAKCFSVYFILCLLAFSKKIDMMFVGWLVAICNSETLKDVDAPQHAHFTDFRHGEKPSHDKLKALVLARQRDRNYFSYTDRIRRRQKGKPTAEQYRVGQEEQSTQIVSLIMDEWPNLPHSIDAFREMLSLLDLNFIDLDRAWESLEPELLRLSGNRDLSAFLLKMKDAMDDISDQLSHAEVEEHGRIWRVKPIKLASLGELIVKPLYMVPRLAGDLTSKACCNSDETASSEEIVDQLPEAHKSAYSKTAAYSSKEVATLGDIIMTFVTSPEVTRQQYGKDLQASLVALKRSQKGAQMTRPISSTDDIAKSVTRLNQILKLDEQKIRDSLMKGEVGSQWLTAGDLWPCLSRVTLLEQLRVNHATHLNHDMKKALIAYGVLVTRIQRVLRMNDAMRCRDERRLREDQSHQGHSNWSPFTNPEWVLLEIDNNVLLRPSQIEVARAIISPATARNSVLQMNMGQG